MIITPAKARRDWFSLDVEAARPLFGHPGLKLDKVGPSGRYLAHRSHLALLEAPEAFKALNEPSLKQKLDTWDVRDARTEALGFKLRTTQQQAIDFMTPRRGALLGDDMRLGKTLSAIMTHDPADGSFVVVAPLSTRGVWLGWLRRVFPEHADNIGIILGRKFDRAIASKPIVFAHYDVIAHWQSDTKIGTLVLDEAHMLTNPDANRSRAAGYLQMQAERVIALTGTPIWDLPPDLWNVVNTITPGAWGGFHDFARRYGDPVTGAYGTTYTGLSNGPELKMRLSEVMLRRRWVDVADDVPAISRSVVVAEVTQAQSNKLDIIAAALKSERTNTAGNLSAYRRQVTNVKLSTVKREATKIMDRGEPVVIWTWHVDYAEAIAAELAGKAFVITGDVAPAERERRIEAWKAQPNSALIATMSVAQVGIDLSHARIAIFAEIDYTPAILGQAEMRTFTPTRGMDVIFIVANHLIDQRIVRALINKLSAADPLGVGAAVDAIEALRLAVMGPTEIGDVDRLLEDFIAGMS